MLAASKSTRLAIDAVLSLTRNSRNIAILEDLGLEVNIIVNDSPLQGYEDKEADPTDDSFGNDICKCRRYVDVNGDTESIVQKCVTSNSKYVDTEKERLQIYLGLDAQDKLATTLMDSECNPTLLDGR